MASRSFPIRSPRLEVTVANGMIVSLRSRTSGEVHADGSLADYAMPRGLGHLGDDSAAAARLHVPWGNHSMDQAIAAGTAFPMMHHFHEGSRYEAQRTATGVHATWTGLTNGQTAFAEETLTVECESDPQTGQVLFRASATSPDGGVYGVQVPIANLHPDHAFYVPSFGGVMYDRTIPPALVTLGGQPFWEARSLAYTPFGPLSLACGVRGGIAKRRLELGFVDCGLPECPPDPAFLACAQRARGRPEPVPRPAASEQRARRSPSTGNSACPRSRYRITTLLSDFGGRTIARPSTVTVRSSAPALCSSTSPLGSSVA